MKGTYTITFRLDWVLSFRGGLGGSPVRLLADGGSGNGKTNDKNSDTCEH